METKQNNPIANIQEQLKQFSKDQAHTEGSGACLFNLIVYTHESRRTAYFNEMIKIIKMQFPCRIILITGNPLIQESLFHVEVASEKRSDGGFTCDEISIRANGPDINRVYFLLPFSLFQIYRFICFGAKTP